MKNLLFLLVFALVLCTGLTDAQWQQTFGPFGFSVEHLAEGNGYIYSSGGKVFRSSDNGITWEEKSEGIWQWDATALFVSNNRIFAGMFGGNDDGYLYISEDNGETWLQHNTTGNDKTITGFTKLGSDLFFSTYQNGIFKSTDNGDTWVQMLDSWINKPGIFDIITLGNTLYFGEYTGLYKSTDGGNTWEHCINPENNCEVFSISVKNNSLYMVYGSCWGYSTSVFKSDDYGNTFQQIATTISLPMKVYSRGGNIYLNTQNGFFRSTDDGTSWIRMTLEGETVHTSLVASNNNIIIGTRSHGIFTSTNNGVSWINTGVQDQITTSNVMAINNTLITGSTGEYGVLISKDNGNTFSQFNYLNYSIVNCLEKRGTDIFAGTTPYFPQSGGIHKSADEGGTWNFIGLPNKEIHSITFNDIYLFAGSMYDGVFRTSNDGNMWAQVSNGLPSAWIRSLIYFDQKLYAATQVGLYSSTNNGNNWNLAAFEYYPVTSLATVNNKLFAATENGVFILNESNQWVQTSLSGNINRLKSYNSILIAAGISILSISDDDGSSWTSIIRNNPGDSFYDVSFNDEYIFVGTNLMGIWRGIIGNIVTDIDGNKTDLPKEYSLYQNYPNPFNPSTKISYKVPVNSNVTLKVYDVLGIEIAILVNEEKSAGSYEVEFNPALSIKNPASGIYFYQLKSGSYLETKKMVMLK